MGGFRKMAALLVKSYILGVRWAGRQRLLCLQQAISYPGEEARLRARVLPWRTRTTSCAPRMTCSSPGWER
jgi:hypothetical protein